jgi:hypothetical protein
MCRSKTRCPVTTNHASGIGLWECGNESKNFSETPTLVVFSLSKPE